jgi:hypothetical protein
MWLKDVGFALRLGVSLLKNKLFPPKREATMNPKDTLSAWSAFSTGTGIFSWIAAVAFILLAVVFASAGQITWMEAGTFIVGIIGWAMVRIRSRFATMKLQATTDAVFDQNKRILVNSLNTPTPPAA